MEFVGADEVVASEHDILDGIASGLRRDRGRDERASVVRVNVVQVEGSQHELLILRALDLLGDEDGSVRELLEEESLS